MRIAYIDCFSGVSGDMLLGAFVSAGWPREALWSLPDSLGVSGLKIEILDVKRHGIEGVKVDVRTGGAQPLRTISDIQRILEGGSLPPRVWERSLDVFLTLAEAEARIHGRPVEKVHFHEVGAVDTLVDVVGTVSALHDLQVERVYCSPIPLSRGWICCEHGTLPLPAPATAELLSGVPVQGVEGSRELATPTGLALVRTLSDSFGSIPEMTIESVGYGAGTGEDPETPNLLRLWLGSGQRLGVPTGVTELRTTIDDMNPEWYGFVMERLFQAGALDVSLVSVQGKKNRPGMEVAVIAPLGKEEDLSRVLFEESTTTGIRVIPCSRYLLPRKLGKVPTPWGTVGAKMITKPDGRKVITPEYEACRELARREGKPMSEVYRAVERAAPEDFIEEE